MFAADLKEEQSRPGKKGGGTGKPLPPQEVQQLPPQEVQQLILMWARSLPPVLLSCIFY